MKFKIIYKFAGKEIKTQEFNQDRIVIGRGSDCDVVVDNLGISRYQCEISIEGENFILKDLKSNGGTLLKGEKINTIQLNDGDEFGPGGRNSFIFLRTTVESKKSAAQ